MDTLKFTQQALALSLIFIQPLQLHAEMANSKVTEHVLNLDLLMEKANQRDQVTANALIDDATFLRRAYINIIGRIPTHQEAKQFLTDPDVDKRVSLVNQLVGSAGMNSHLFNMWADLLRVKTNPGGGQSSGLAWNLWLRDAVENNMPYDEMVREMLKASGHAAENAAVGYYLRDRNMLLDNMSNTVQIFLGNRIGCAQCHDHPFENMTQKEYFQMAAFAAGTEYRSEKAKDQVAAMVKSQRPNVGNAPKASKGQNSNGARGSKVLYKNFSSLFKDVQKDAIYENPSKALKLPADYKYNDGEPGEKVTPAVLFGNNPADFQPEHRRAVFADWLSARDNPYFTTVYVNRLWSHVFGRGIVEPLDDWTETTKISHPEVLNYLAELAKSSNYDTREILRVLYHTQLFQRHANGDEPPMGQAFHWAGPPLRRLSAEELRDSLVTLNAGNVDNVRNQKMLQKWQTNQQTALQLLHGQPDELVKIDAAYDKSEEEKRAVQRETRALQLEAQDARKAGDMKKASLLMQQVAAKRKAYKRKLKEQSEESMASSVSMMGMTYQGKPEKAAFMRSSELPTPHHPGEFLRNFGASDRMTPDAGHTQASIPQSLTLMNGSEIRNFARNSKNFTHELNQQESPADQLDMLFLSIYAAYPSESERLDFSPYLQNPKNSKQRESLVRAMLTSKRFLFVQ
ncbi:DUF1549 domain-containing protein [Persicirhabdus sediminis]|uniref:DUF1549 domain-containing protein n=1 Tax=Persicirhabdus sediminis TaxID=454144 RepID=A0A8J7MBW3_9BACT|nr:DUF1549 domain-containing protein [Persicirhabdus sediminis]MBK1789646.1 DUF1549 domain-containing protein [Persicirhabdus sediminis]